MARRQETAVIPAAIQEWRKHRGLTQAGLATAAGVSEALIAHAENGRRGLSRASVDKIAAALQIPSTAIATLTGEAA